MIKKYPILNDILYIFILIFFLIKYRYPLIFMMNDDYFVLPELAWFFNNPTETIKHFAFFNQTRFTWTGDLLLFRPGLFLYYLALFKIASIFDLSVTYNILTVVNILLYCLIYFLFCKYTLKITSFCLSLFLFCNNGNEILLSWPHIHGYVIGIILFFISALIVDKFHYDPFFSKFKNRKYLFFIAALIIFSMCFHEFIQITFLFIYIYICLKLLFFPSQIHYSHDKFIIYLLSIPLFLFFSIRTLNLFLYKNIFLNADNLTHAFINYDKFKSSIITIFNISLGVNISDNNILLLFILFTFALSMFLSFKENDLFIIFIHFAFISLSLLIIFGRLTNNDHVSPWYFPIFNILIILIILSFLNKIYFFIKPKFLLFALCILLITIIGLIINGIDLKIKVNKLLHNNIINSAGNKWIIEKNGFKEISGNDFCFSGKGINLSNDTFKSVDVLKGSGYPLGNKELSLLFYEYICNTNENKKPLIFSYELNKYILSPVLNIPKFMKSAKKDELYEYSSLYDSKALNNRNIYQLTNLDKILEMPTGYVFKTKNNIRYLRLNIRSKDPFPTFYNFGIKIVNSSKFDDEYYIYLNGNDIIIYYNNIPIGVEIIPFINSEVIINLIQENSTCYIFINNYKFAELNKCNLNGYEYEYFNFSNGSPFEYISNISYSN